MTFHGIKNILVVGKLFKYAEYLYIVQKIYRGAMMNEYMSYEEYLEKVKTGILTFITTLLPRITTRKIISLPVGEPHTEKRNVRRNVRRHT